jgi:hypothetical protein
MADLQSTFQQPSEDPNTLIKGFHQSLFNKKESRTESDSIDFRSAALDPQKFLILDLNSDRKLPDNVEAQDEKLGERIFANFHTMPIEMLAIGTNRSLYWNHGSISEKVKDLLKKENAQNPLLAGVSQAQFFELLEESYVAGFKYGSRVLIRIETRCKNWDSSDTASYFKLCRRYREAVRMATAFTKTIGGSVELEIGDDFGISVAKTIGALSLVSREQQSDEPFIKRSRQYLPEGVFYYSPRGTRYKTIGQFENDLYGSKSITSAAPEEYFSRYRNRAACLEYLSKAATLMHPGKRNQAASNKREAQFLLLHPDTDTLLREGDTKGKYEIQLQNLYEALRQLYPSQEEWRMNLDSVDKVLKEFIQSIKDASSPLGHRDYFQNPKWIEVISSIINGSSEVPVDTLSLGKSFHTPLKASTIGSVDLNYEGIPEFAINESAPQYQKEAIQKVLSLYPNAKNAHWIVMCEPQIPLTQDDLTLSAIKKYEMYEDESLVVLFGKINTPENRLVIRKDPFRTSSWKMRQTPEVKKLLENFDPEELTHLVHRFKHWQSVLFNRILQSCSKGESRFLPPFIPDGEYLIREFLDGKVCSRMERNKLTFEQMTETMRMLGPICATYHYAQRSTFAFHELLLDGTDTPNAKLSLLPIGTTETFCNHRIIRQPLSRYRENSASLYGAHVASWVSSFIHGPEGAKLSREGRRSAQNSLLMTWAESLRVAMLAVSSSDLHLDEIRNEYSDTIKQIRDSNREIPSDFNFLTCLPFTRKLLASSSSDIEHTVEVFLLNARSFTGLFHQRIGIHGNESTYDQREHLNSTIYSLLNNHLDTSYANRIERLLDNKIVDLKRCSSSECQSLLSIADVTTRLSKIISANRALQDGVQLLAEEALRGGRSSKDFCSFVKQLPANIRLSHPQAEDFYSAVREITSIYLGTEDENERRRIAYYVKTVSLDLLELFPEIQQ